VAENDPYRAYNFRLEIAGLQAGAFTEVSGLGVKIEPIQFREGGDPQSVRHVPGPVEYAPVTLRYGLTKSQDLWTWLMRTVGGQIERRSASIIQLDSTGVEAMRWDLSEAWPSEWKGAPLDAMSGEIAIENLTLVYDRIERRVK
jgi:phage tail-like protein